MFGVGGGGGDEPPESAASRVLSTVHKLQNSAAERGLALLTAGDQSARLATSAGEFSSMAAQLAAREERRAKRWF